MTSQSIRKCSHCVAEIPKVATVCSHCRRDQNESWYKKVGGARIPLILSVLIFVAFNYGLFEKNYSNYNEDFDIKQENIISLNDIDKRVVFKINNNSNVMWKKLAYQVITKHDGKVVDVESRKSNYWAIQPHSSSYITVETYAKHPNTTWEFVITGLSSGK